MKTILNSLKHWVMFWVGALVTIVIWGFAYNLTYTKVDYVSSWQSLTADTFNQLITNVEYLQTRGYSGSQPTYFSTRYFKKKYIHYFLKNKTVSWKCFRVQQAQNAFVCSVIPVWCHPVKCSFIVRVTHSWICSVLLQYAEILFAFSFAPPPPFKFLK
jgi:hypothetical protein